MRPKEKYVQPTSSLEGDYSLRRIQRLVWLPIAILVAAFFTAISIQEILEQTKHDDRFAEKWSAVWLRHEPLLVNELYLGQDGAVTKRSEAVLSEINSAFPGYSYCIRVAPKMARGAEIDLCQNSGVNVVAKQIDLLMGPEALASVTVLQVAQPSLIDLFPKRVAWSLIFSILVSVIIVQVIGRTVIARIVTPLLKVIEARSRDAAIGRTSQMLAHDVRRPFSLLDMAIHSVETAATPDEALKALRHHLPALRKAQKRTTMMLQDVMSVGRGTATALVTEGVSLQVLIDGVVKDSDDLCRSKDISIDRIYTHQKAALIEPAKIERVISNLLVNAIEASPRGGHVKVRVYDHNAQNIGVEIANSGSFITPQERAQIFDAFYTHGKREGTGLGLTIAKNFVDLHGGEIWCDSDRDSGTRFSFTIPSDPAWQLVTGAQNRQNSTKSLDDLLPPALKDQVPQDQDRQGASLSPHGLSETNEIIVVEDDPFIREVWSKSLAGRKVTVFESPNQLLAKLKEQPELLNKILCLVTDFHFDNDVLSGAELIEVLRSQGISTPFFVSTDSDVSLNLPADVRRLLKSEAPFLDAASISAKLTAPTPPISQPQHIVR